MKCRRVITKYVSLGKLLKIGWKYWQAKLQLEKFKMNIFDDLSEPNANSEHFLFFCKKVENWRLLTIFHFQPKLSF
jgi:hypothetical protein